MCAGEEESGFWHYAVLLNESLEYLAIRPDGIYVDLTAGLGGHTRAIAERLESGFVIACDRDAESLELARTRVLEQTGIALETEIEIVGE